MTLRWPGCCSRVWSSASCCMRISRCGKDEYLFLSEDQVVGSSRFFEQVLRSSRLVLGPVRLHRMSDCGDNDGSICLVVVSIRHACVKNFVHNFFFFCFLYRPCSITETSLVILSIPPGSRIGFSHFVSVLGCFCLDFVAALLKATCSRLSLTSWSTCRDCSGLEDRTSKSATEIRGQPDIVVSVCSTWHFEDGLGEIIVAQDTALRRRIS